MCVSNCLSYLSMYFACFSLAMVLTLLCFLVKDPLDYQGRSFLHAPQDVGVNLRSDSPPERCFLPKAHIHTWQGHTKGISTIRWFPKTAHLLLSCSMDCRVKVSVYADVTLI
jgi:pre-mRNA-processing factor 17